MSAASHRYLTRIQTLLARLDTLLAEQDRSVCFTILGVDHTGHILPDTVPELASADLVTLELPTTPVRAYLQDGMEAEIHLRNIFWRDLLEHFRRRPACLGTYGVNVNPHVRYLRGRFYYRGGAMLNDFEAPPVVVEPASGSSYVVSDLGGSGDLPVTAAAVLNAVSPEAREAFVSQGLVHVGPAQNPFGPGAAPGFAGRTSAGDACARGLAAARLRPQAEAHHLEEAALFRLAFSEFVEGFLLPVNDFYLVEQLLRHVIRSITAPGVEPVRATHVAGCAHSGIIQRYLTLAPTSRITVEVRQDPRFPLHPAQLVPQTFERRLPEALAAVSLREAQFLIDVRAADELLDWYFRDEPGDAERRVLLRAIWTLDVPRPALTGDFRSLADETPLEPSRRYLDEYATRLDRAVLEFALAEMPLPDLREINARLRSQQRRGLPWAVGQELQERGFGFRELREHPVLGPHARRVDCVREGLLSHADAPDVFSRCLQCGCVTREGLPTSPQWMRCADY